ncbi:MAG: class I SAM-dependent methyltransferase [Actinomycetota bacterium]
MQEADSDSKVFERNWSDYYRAVENRPPRETLLKALELFDLETIARERFAVDLGCGEGRDAVELLRRGWRVLGIDGQPEALSHLMSRPNLLKERLETQVMRFEAISLPENVDLVNASFSLPFCPPAAFPSLWAKILGCLRVGGRFSGQLFGDRDSWAVYPSINHHTRQQIEALLQPFEVEMFEEEEHPGKTALGEDKHWHIFQLVIRKR